MLLHLQKKKGKENTNTSLSHAFTSTNANKTTMKVCWPCFLLQTHTYKRLCTMDSLYLNDKKQRSNNERNPRTVLDVVVSWASVDINLAHRQA